MYLEAPKEDAENNFILIAVYGSMQLLFMGHFFSCENKFLQYEIIKVLLAVSASIDYV